MNTYSFLNYSNYILLLSSICFKNLQLRRPPCRANLSHSSMSNSQFRYNYWSAHGFLILNVSKRSSYNKLHTKYFVKVHWNMNVISSLIFIAHYSNANVWFSLSTVYRHTLLEKGVPQFIPLTSRWPVQHSTWEYLGLRKTVQDLHGEGEEDENYW